MLNPKYFILLASFFTLSAGAYAAKLDKDGILRSDDDDGSILYMSQNAAMKACPQGTHLPTIRELAGLSQSMGAKGILETSAVKDGKVPDGYYLVDAKNPDGNQDKFYFNDDGYNRPESALGRNYFWSSSVYSGDSDFGYILLGVVGYVYYGGRGLDDYAVRCVVGQ